MAGSTIEYVHEQNDCGINVGDTVEVLRISFKGEGGWQTDWNPKMDDLVGKTGLVKYVEEYGVNVKFEGIRDWWFPFFVLAKVGNL